MAETDSNYFANHFNTQLSYADEMAFQLWLSNQSKVIGRNVSNDIMDYDLRGFWDKNTNPTLSGAHLPDTFKKPNHPTFSDESIYSGTPAPGGGKYIGGRWIGSNKNGWTFQVSQEMLKKTHSRGALQQYFADFEPDAGLVMPAINAR